MRARRATECWLAGRRKACVEGTHRHMHARGVQLSLRLQAVEKRSPIRRKSKRCTCAPTQAILSAKEAAMGLCGMTVKSKHDDAAPSLWSGVLS